MKHNAHLRVEERVRRTSVYKPVEPKSLHDLTTGTNARVHVFADSTYLKGEVNFAGTLLNASLQCTNEVEIPKSTDPRPPPFRILYIEISSPQKIFLDTSIRLFLVYSSS